MNVFEFFASKYLTWILDVGTILQMKSKFLIWPPCLLKYFCIPLSIFKYSRLYHMLFLDLRKTTAKYMFKTKEKFICVTLSTNCKILHHLIYLNVRWNSKISSDRNKSNLPTQISQSTMNNINYILILDWGCVKHN